MGQGLMKGERRRSSRCLCDAIVLLMWTVGYLLIEGLGEVAVRLRSCIRNRVAEIGVCLGRVFVECNVVLIEMGNRS